MGQIKYSEKYVDDTYEYRHAVLPPDVAKSLPKNRLLSEGLSDIVDKCGSCVSGPSVSVQIGDVLSWKEVSGHMKNQIGRTLSDLMLTMVINNVEDVTTVS